MDYDLLSKETPDALYLDPRYEDVENAAEYGKQLRASAWNRRNQCGTNNRFY